MSTALALMLLAAAAAPAAAVTGHDMLMRELTMGTLERVADAKESWVAAKRAEFARTAPRPARRALLTDYNTCMNVVPCAVQINNAYVQSWDNETYDAITNPALCPIVPGFADRCFYVRARHACVLAEH